MNEKTEIAWLKILLVAAILTILIQGIFIHDSHKTTADMSRAAVKAWEDQKALTEACETERDLLRENVLNLQEIAYPVVKLEPLEPLPENCSGK